MLIFVHNRSIKLNYYCYNFKELVEIKYLYYHEIQSRKVEVKAVIYKMFIIVET